MEDLTKMVSDSTAALFWAAVFLWFGGRPLARIIYTGAGKMFGFYNPEHYSKFLGLIGWRGFYALYLPLRFWFADFKGGLQATAKFAPFFERAYNVFRAGDIPVGKNQILGIPLMQPVGISSKTGRHLAIVANTGGGKTVYLMTMLSLHKGNAFVIDCDAQMYNALAGRIGGGGSGIVGKGKDVFVIDPYKLSAAETSACWNPILEIDAAVRRHGEDAAIDFARTLAAGLIKSLDNRNEWVYSGSRNFLTALILYVWAYESEENRHLCRVRDLLTMGLRGVVDDEKYNPFDVLLFEMKEKTEDFEGIISKAAATMKASQKITGENPIRSDATDQTAWLDLPQLRRLVKTSDFTCEDLKLGNASLFFVAPVTDIQSKLSGFIRTLTMMTMEVFQKIPARPKHSTLFVMDEFPSLGRIDMFVSAAAVFRKYGVRLITVTQNLERLQAAYPDNWGGFLGDSEATIWMSNEHKQTLEYLSGILGTHTRSERVKPSLLRRLWNKERAHTQQVERPLLYPDQLRQMLGRNIIITRNGKRPLRIKPIPYYKELPVYHYEADRNFAENPLRQLTRRACLWLEKEMPVYRLKLRAYFKPKAKKLKEIK